MPRPLPDPVASAPLFVAFCLSTVAAAFLGGYRLTEFLFDRYVTREKP